MTDLTWEMNPFGGALVDSRSVDPDPNIFSDQLKRAIQTWEHGWRFCRVAFQLYLLQGKKGSSFITPTVILQL